VRIRTEDGWTERDNQNDCSHDEGLVLSVIATGGVEQKDGKSMWRILGRSIISQFKRM